MLLLACEIGSWACQRQQVVMCHQQHVLYQWVHAPCTTRHQHLEPCVGARLHTACSPGPVTQLGRLLATGLATLTVCPACRLTNVTTGSTELGMPVLVCH